MKYEFDVDWHKVDGISDDVLKEILPKEDSPCRRTSCLVKYKNGDVEALYIESTEQLIGSMLYHDKKHPFRGFTLAIIKSEPDSNIDLRDEDLIMQYLKDHKFIVFKQPFVNWKYHLIHEDIEMIATVPDNTILKSVIRKFL